MVSASQCICESLYTAGHTRQVVLEMEKSSGRDIFARKLCLGTPRSDGHTVSKVAGYIHVAMPSATLESTTLPLENVGDTNLGGCP